MITSAGFSASLTASPSALSSFFSSSSISIGTSSSTSCFSTRLAELTAKIPLGLILTCSEPVRVEILLENQHIHDRDEQQESPSP